MTTDPAVTVVVLSIAFLVFCAVGACVQHYLDWRDDINRRRDLRRAKILVRRIEQYGIPKVQAPDYLPAWMEREAA